jgi:hypothetical protein
MKLVTKGFSANGHADLVGTLVAVGDDGEHLGVEHRGNFSDGKVVDWFIRKLTADCGVSEERGWAALAQALKNLRKAADVKATAFDPLQDKPGRSQSGAQADRLIGLALKRRAVLFVDQLGTPHMAPKRDGTLIHRIDSRATRRWLTSLM